jgi:hypothetical protein
MRIMLDSNIYDRIIEAPDFVDLLERAVTRGQMVMLFTHIQETTADTEADILVTGEKKRLPNRIRDANSKLSVWNFEEFAAHVRSLK